MLEQIYDQVDLVVYSQVGAVKVISSLLKSFFFSLFSLKKYDLVCGWFVGYHTFFPYFFGKFYKTTIVSFLGGTECHNMPEYNHGNYRKKVYGWVTKKSLEKSTYILPVHESLITCDISYVDLVFPKQGFLPFNNHLDGHIEALHCGFDEENEGVEIEKQPNSFLSVASQLSGKVFYRKGIDMLISLAKELPEYKFTIVGSNYKGEHLPNLEIVSFIPYSELIDIYRSHQFYLQFSIAEGFPNALAEAMLYGCIPMGSNVFGIPDIIGDTGFILDKKEVNKAVKMLSSVVNLPEEKKAILAMKARNKVKTMYTPANRLANFKRILKL
jgi:glycosyltransferase involved in cell wall biosynthesis